MERSILAACGEPILGGLAGLAGLAAVPSWYARGGRSLGFNPSGVVRLWGLVSQRRAFCSGVTHSARTPPGPGDSGPRPWAAVLRGWNRGRTRRVLTQLGPVALARRRPRSASGRSQQPAIRRCSSHLSFSGHLKNRDRTCQVSQTAYQALIRVYVRAIKSRPAAVALRLLDGYRERTRFFPKTTNPNIVNAGFQELAQ